MESELGKFLFIMNNDLFGDETVDAIWDGMSPEQQQAWEDLADKLIQQREKTESEQK